MTSDALELHPVTAFTGTATRFGIVFADPPTIGSSLLPAPNTFYAQATTVGGGVLATTASPRRMGITSIASTSPTLR